MTLTLIEYVSLNPWLFARLDIATKLYGPVWLTVFSQGSNGVAGSMAVYAAVT